MKQIGKIEKLLNDFDSALLHCNGRLFNNANNNKKNKNQQTRETHTKKERNDGRVLRKLFVKEWDVSIWDGMKLLQADQWDVDRLSIILVS